MFPILIIFGVLCLKTASSFSVDVESSDVIKRGNEDFISYNSNEDVLKIRYSLIYPDTKWCGSGNIARNYNDLGLQWRTDKCCRDHDFCPDFIPAMGTKHGLRNEAVHTRLSCECDSAFWECLKATSSNTADIVGALYFDISGTKCYSKTWYGRYYWKKVKSYLF